VNLSIFNSNRLILKSVILFILIFFFYYLLILITKPQVKTFQNQWSKNFSIAQDYLYNDGQYKNVIVGSSMSQHLTRKELENHHTFNLSLASETGLTGLKILSKCQKFPEKIFIETNSIAKKNNNEMVNRLFTPLYWKIKKYIIVLQEKYHPINVLMSIVKSAVNPSSNNSNQTDPDRLMKMIELRLEKKDESKNYKYTEEMFELKKLLKCLRQKGIQTIFFRMPVHPKIAVSESYKKRVKFLKKEFADVPWLPMPNYEKYSTVDGIHLTGSGAVKFSKKFVKLIDSSQKNKDSNLESIKSS